MNGDEALALAQQRMSEKRQSARTETPVKVTLPTRLDFHSVYMLYIGLYGIVLMLIVLYYSSIAMATTTHNTLHTPPQQQHMNMLASEIATRLKITDFGSSQMNTGIKSS